MPYTGCRWRDGRRLMDDVGEVAQVVLHRRDLGQPIQRPDDEECVAQPAVAVVPRALRVRRFGNARRDGRHDGARFLVRAELQRDRRADDRVLPFGRQRERTHPAPPVVIGALLELARDIADVAIDGFVDAEQQVDGTVEQVPRLVDRIGDGHVGGEAHRLAGVEITDVMAAARDVGPPRTVFERRLKPDANRRSSVHRRNAPHQQHRPERSAAVGEARREVGDAHDVAISIRQLRLEYRRIANVALPCFDAVREFHGKTPGRAGVRRAEQRMQDRITVRPRHAAPDNRPCFVDECIERAVTDESDLETRTGVDERIVHGRRHSCLDVRSDTD